MHKSSVWHMQDCVNRHFVGKRPIGNVVDVGAGYKSFGDVSPYREIFTRIGWSYIGLDLAPANNVDIVVEDPFIWPIADDTFDAVVSGQMVEHNPMFWLTFLEMSRVLRPGGIMVHIAPSRGYEHKAPTDCWRVYRDGMDAIGAWCGLRCVEATTDWTSSDLEVVRDKRPRVYDSIPRKGKFAEGAWGDTVGVFVKPENWQPGVALRYMEAYLGRLNVKSGAWM